MSDAKLNLIVLKTHQFDSLNDFYSALGLSFVEEKHGDGPLHLAARVRGEAPRAGRPRRRKTLSHKVVTATSRCSDVRC